MSRRTKITVWICVLMLCAAGATLSFQKEIRITYHRNRMFAAMEDHGVMSGQTRISTVLENLRFKLLHLSSVEVSETMYQHEKALIKLGYLEKREFHFLKRKLKAEPSDWPALYQQITNTFDSSHWFSCSFEETNMIAVTATPEDIRKWEKLTSDFDR
jgi:hypothetical protein